jgi:hypothetical protein
MSQINCDQCEAAMIQGVFCHETGCPNSRKTWEDGEWILYLECRECGSDVRAGESCDCSEVDWKPCEDEDEVEPEIG